MQVHISIAAEPIFHLGKLAVTNSMLLSWFLVAFLILFSYQISRKIRLVPGRMQSLAETVIESLLKLMESVAGKRARDFFPLLATFFIFILLGNWSELLPGVGTIGFYLQEEGKEVFTPLLRGITSDLNTTFALAIISVLAIHYYSFKHLGASKHLNHRLFHPMGLFESLADLTKIISFSFRLFGNLFAGEVLLAVIAFLMPVILPLPFMVLELFVGFVQALIFTMLSLIFLSTAVAVD